MSDKPVLSVDQQVVACIYCGEEVSNNPHALKLHAHLPCISANVGLWPHIKDLSDTIRFDDGMDDEPQQEDSERPADYLSTCPGCGGYADNGHDRCDPPAPYYCTKCDESERVGGACDCGAVNGRCCCERVGGNVESVMRDTAPVPESSSKELGKLLDALINAQHEYTLAYERTKSLMSVDSVKYRDELAAARRAIEEYDARREEKLAAAEALVKTECEIARTWHESAMKAHATVSQLREQLEAAQTMARLFDPMQWLQGWDAKVVDDPTLINLDALAETLHDPDEPITETERRTMLVIVDALSHARNTKASE